MSRVRGIELKGPTLQRRDVLRGLTALAGSGLYSIAPWRMWASAQSTAEQVTPLAKPIRGLVRRDGRLMQPIEIYLSNAAAGVAAVTRIDATDVDRRVLSAGENTYSVFVEPVSVEQDVAVAVTANDRTETATVRLRPVHRILTYILPHSHHDLGYTDIQTNIEEKQMHNIALGIELARKTADYPEGARFVWNLEVLWSADFYMQRKSEAEKEEFIEAVRHGWVALNGMYANELTGLCRPEELLQLFRYGTKLGRQCGVKLDSAMLSDVPGFTWGTVTAMSQADLRYLSAAPNNSDRIGRLRSTWSERPFWLSSPSNRWSILVWMPSRGYTNAPPDERFIEDHQERLDDLKFEYSIDYLRWSGRGDNGAPDPELCEFLKRWNTEYEWPKYVLASTSAAFSVFEQKHGNDIPRLKGDVTPYWDDGAGSSALETAINRNSADRLSQAEALMAMSDGSAFSTDEFTDAWRDVLLYSEHTWGASNSVRAPQSESAKKEWAFKKQFALDGETASTALLAKALARRGNTGAAKIDVINTTSWPRTELVYLTKELSASGDRVTDSGGRSVPSQRLSTGELAFLATDVPAFGSRTYAVSAGRVHEPSRPVTIKHGILDNTIVRAQIDPTTGNLIEFVLHGQTGNLVDKGSGEAVNQYVYVEGKDFAALQKEGHGVDFKGPDIGSVQSSGVASLLIEEQGPLVASLRIESSAPGCNSLTRTIKLVAGADWIEIANLVDKKPSLLNPYPDNINPSRAFAQYGGKESLHFAFPFAVENGTMHIDIPLSEMRPETDQLPGGNRNWLPVGRWVDVSNAHEGVTWVTLDAPLLEVGEISATLPGSQHDSSLWRERIAPTQKLYSWVMNNYWETNYRASQEGKVNFRYAIRAHHGYAPAMASKFAIGLSQPLLTAAAEEGAPASVVPEIEPSDVLALTVKPADEGDALIVRLFGASGEHRNATLRWKDGRKRKVWRSDLSEQSLEPIEGPIPLAGWDLITLRIEQS